MPILTGGFPFSLSVFHFNLYTWNFIPKEKKPMEVGDSSFLPTSSLPQMSLHLSTYSYIFSTVSCYQCF